MRTLFQNDYLLDVALFHSVVLFAYNEIIKRPIECAYPICSCLVNYTNCLFGFWNCITLMILYL